ncbi:MAG: hypothetical protein ACE5JQ_03490 [Candidatus Methylomirabilales bacterium]
MDRINPHSLRHRRKPVRSCLDVHPGNQTVPIVDTSSDQVVATIPVGEGPKVVAAGIVPTR